VTGVLQDPAPAVSCVLQDPAPAVKMTRQLLWVHEVGSWVQPIL
jgi:hypothetical protein